MTGPPGETPDVSGAYPRLSEEHIATLSRAGHRRPTAAGDVLIREGQRDRDFLVILAGTVGVYEGYGSPDQRLIRVNGPRRFLDELSLLNRQPSYVSSVVREPGEVLAVPVPALREVAARNPALGDLIVRALICRRQFLIGAVTGIQIIGSRYDPDTRRLREFATRNRLPYTWIDLEDDKAAEAMLQQLGVAAERTPLVIWGGATTLSNPTDAELATAIGLAPPSPQPDRLHDLVVVGAGPAGLAAAVYGASEGLDTVVLDAVAAGGQAGTSPLIENYLGFPAGIPGAELADRAIVQAEKFGAAIHVPRRASGLTTDGGHHVVHLSDGGHLTTRTVVIATGAQYRTLDVPRLEEFEGSCIHYAATFVEARFCGEQPVVVVGGGNSAGQAALFLSQHSASVRLVIRHDDLGRDMSRYLVDQIERNPDVEVLHRTQVCALEGDGGLLRWVVVEDRATGRRTRLSATRLFVFIGARPGTEWLRGELSVDDRGYIQTSVLETSHAGVLAVGDVRSGSIKRVASAVGEGAAAVRLIHERLSGSRTSPAS